MQSEVYIQPSSIQSSLLIIKWRIEERHPLKDDRLSIKKTPVLINVQISASYLARRLNLIQIEELSIRDTFYDSGHTYLLNQHDVI